jgi:hypothetical protein
MSRDKLLLLVGQACVAIDFLLTSTDNYVETHDRAFLQLARQAKALADSTENAFWTAQRVGRSASEFGSSTVRVLREGWACEQHGE